MTDENVKESALLLLLYMDTVATAAKMGNPLAQPYLDADAIRIMPDGVCIYQKDRFLQVMATEMVKQIQEEG